MTDESGVMGPVVTPEEAAWMDAVYEQWLEREGLEGGASMRFAFYSGIRVSPHSAQSPQESPQECKDWQAALAIISSLRDFVGEGARHMVGAIAAVHEADEFCDRMFAARSAGQIPTGGRQAQADGGTCAVCGGSGTLAALAGEVRRACFCTTRDRE